MSKNSFTLNRGKIINLRGSIFKQKRRHGYRPHFIFNNLTTESFLPLLGYEAMCRARIRRSNPRSNRTRSLGITIFIAASLPHNRGSAHKQYEQKCRNQPAWHLHNLHKQIIFPDKYAFFIPLSQSVHLKIDN